MLRKQLLILCLGLSVTTIAQKRISEFKNSLKTTSSNIKDVIPVVDKQKDEIAFFVADAKNVYGYKFDNNFNLKGKLSSTRKKRLYKVLLGSSISNDGDYRVFVSSSRQDQFASINFSFKDNSSDIKEFYLPEGERFIQTISYNNKFYLLSGNKPKKALYVYTFDDEGDFKRDRINHFPLFYVNKSGKEVVKVTDLLIKDGDLNKFEDDTPNSIETVSDKRKMYIRGNNAVFTFDYNKDNTQVFILNLDSLTVKKKAFKKPLDNIKSSKKKTNSFIHKNYVYTIAASRDVFSMYINDYNTGEFIKEFAFTKDEKIPFKNSAIIQEGGFYDSYRELEKTKKFLRKITSQNIGVSVIDNKGDYQITLGGYVAQRSGGMMMMPGFGMPVASFGNVSVFFNPTALAYNSFSNSKSVRIECLFDPNFNHIENKKVTDNAFEKMKKASAHYNNSDGTVFRYKDYFIKADYVRGTKTYILRKYTN